MLSREGSQAGGGVFLARAPELLAAVMGALVGLARSSFGAGFVAFVIVSLGLELGLEFRERMLSRSPSKLAKIIDGRLREAGISPQSDHADLFSASVLVVRATPTTIQVFGPDGRVLAMGASVGLSRLERLLSEVTNYATPERGPLLQVYADRIFNPRSYAVVYPDRHVGSVFAAGRDKGSVYETGVGVIGHLKRSWRGGILPGVGREFSLYNSAGQEVSHITSKRRLFTTWNVIEIDPGISEPLRTLLLAATAAVDSWTMPKGGGA